MGERGARSGTYELNINGKMGIVEYGREYRSVYQYDNAKYIVKNNGATTSPMETMSGEIGRIYVTISKRDNKPVSVTYYNKEGFAYKEIDYRNHGHGIHAHDISYSGGSFKRGKSRKPSAAELRKARQLRAIWRTSGIDVTRKK